MRRLLPSFAALALVVAACGDDDTGPSTSGEPRSTTTVESTTTTSSMPDVSTTGEIDGRETALEQRCTSPDGFTVSYPDDWAAVGDCGQFGPSPLDEPAPATDERPGVVSAYVDPVPFETVTTPAVGDGARAVTTVDGRQAVRVESTVTGESLYPEGTEVVRWLVDLAIGGDDGAGTLFVDALDLRDDVDFDEAVTVLDRMARSLQIEAGDAPASDQVVARYEGGGTPFTVAATGSASTPATCLRLLDQDGMACVEAVGGAPDVSLTSLASPSGPIAAGIASADVFAVDVHASGDTLTFLPVPYPGRNALAFAVPVAPDDITGLTLRDHAGEVLAEVPVEEALRPADE